MFETKESEDLKQNLRHFGLNPAQWDLRNCGRGRYLIVNRDDRGFSLLGTTVGRKGRRRWNGLALRSV